MNRIWAWTIDIIAVCKSEILSKFFQLSKYMIHINLPHFLIDQFCLPLGSDKLFAKILLWSPGLLVILPALPCPVFSFHTPALWRCFCKNLCLGLGLPGGSAGKESACKAGDLGSISELGRSPGEGKGYPLQYSGLENSMDCVHGVAESQTQLSNFHFHFSFPGGSVVKESACQCRRRGFDPWVRKIPWRRKSSPVFLPGKSHGQRSLVGYSSWGRKESDKTEVTKQQTDSRLHAKPWVMSPFRSKKATRCGGWPPAGTSPTGTVTDYFSLLSPFCTAVSTN